MAKIEIVIDGKAYPCRQTMGAMLRFRNETGRDVTEIKGDVGDMTTLLWCSVVSACKHDGVEFNMSLMDFADCIDKKALDEWTAAMNVAEAAENGDEDADGEKKSH